MGILRIYLAIVVLLWHCPQGVLIHQVSLPALAVQCFYAISGFYVQLLIRQFVKIGGNWKIAFYWSRLLRIYPTYLIMLLLSCVFLPTTLVYYMHAPFTEMSQFVVNNVLILTQPLYRVMGGSSIILPQAWTLSLELMFYLLAPYIVTRSNVTVLLVILASIVCRIVLVKNDLYKHFWFYGFFPNEIALFLAGSLAYRFYDYYIAKAENNLQVLYKMIGFFVFIFLFWFSIKGWRLVHGGAWEDNSTLGAGYKYWAVLLLTIISLPFIFNLTKSSKIDRYIGDLSYPMYLGHFFFIFIIGDYVADGYKNIAVLGLTLLLSLILMHTFEIPLSKYRQSLKSKKINIPKEVAGLNVEVLAEPQ